MMGDDVYCYKNGPGCYSMAAVVQEDAARSANVVPDAAAALEKAAGKRPDGKQLHAIDVGDGELVFVWATCLPDAYPITDEQRNQRHTREGLDMLRKKLGLAPSDRSNEVY